VSANSASSSWQRYGQIRKLDASRVDIDQGENHSVASAVTAPELEWDARALDNHFDGMACWWAADLDPRLAGQLTAFLGRVV
jgi:hypothetical protein